MSDAAFHAVAIYATPDGGSALLDLPLPLCRKISSGAWEGIAGATGWGITQGDGEGYGEWHVSAMAGLSIVLRGAWAIEAGDGARRVLRPGDMLVMLDTTGCGHCSQTLEQPCTVIGIAFDANTAARLRQEVEAIR